MGAARTMTGFALHTHQMTGHTHVDETTGFVKTHHMALDTRRVEGLADRFEIVIGHGVIAAGPDLVFGLVTSLADLLAHEGTLSLLALLTQFHAFQVGGLDRCIVVFVPATHFLRIGDGIRHG